MQLLALFLLMAQDFQHNQPSLPPAAIVQQRWQNLFGDDVPIVEPTSTEAEEQREHEIERFEFEQKFNRFVEKVRDFTNNYNSGRIDVKQIKDIQKAWKDLSKTMWFKADPKSNAVQ